MVRVTDLPESLGKLNCFIPEERLPVVSSEKTLSEANPVPLMVTAVPTGPEDGEMEIVGATVGAEIVK